ncbi:hypothetical protein CLV28_0182 [Sediminihabitans luteus]|uniref:Uncharacterized protein n=1 Tax=Sediminihabitans luteus TaxID=1138585 RepID=A0A2M9CYI5_9CELL|nr:hypothetical protein [Sediminihabitans luteus]PJJ76970.1 hypothetical protein CLV28_0182 [Sediminihabitans luteus]GII99611.1 hypothetical protein Slu03_19890 [Sediminihabitans luteus]
MSTVPGEESFHDAGLTPPDDRVVDAARDPLEHRPDEPRPDLDGLADEADVVEQAAEVPEEDPDDAPPR